MSLGIESKLSQILSEIPLMGSPKAFELLSETVAKLLRQSVPDVELLLILERLHPTIEMLLMNVYDRQEWPEQLSANRCALQIAKAYLDCVRGAAKPLSLAHNILALQRGILYLVQIQHACYFHYHELPEEWWNFYHQFYSNAKSLALQSAPMLTNSLRFEGISSFEDFYKAGLFLAIAGQSHFQQREMRELFDFCLQFANLLQFKPAQEARGWAITWTRNAAPEMQKNTQIESHNQSVLDTSALLNHLMELKILLLRFTDKQLKIDQRSISLSLVERLLQGLNGQQQRRYPRVAGAGRVQLMPFELSTKISIPVSEWKIVNTSAEGYCLERQSYDLPILPADFLRVQESKLLQEQNWFIATVRWVKRDELMVRVGLRLLAPSAKSVRVTLPKPAGVKLTPRIAAVLFSRLVLQGNNPSLLLPKSLVRPGMVVTVEEEGKVYKVQIAKALSENERFAEYGFEPVVVVDMV